MELVMYSIQATLRSGRNRMTLHLVDNDRTFAVLESIKARGIEVRWRRVWVRTLPDEEMIKNLVENVRSHDWTDKEIPL